MEKRLRLERLKKYAVQKSKAVLAGLFTAESPVAHWVNLLEVFMILSSMNQYILSNSIAMIEYLRCTQEIQSTIWLLAKAINNQESVAGSTMKMEEV